MSSESAPDPLRPLTAANPLFKYILIFVGALTVLCLVGAILLAIFAPKEMTPAQTAVLERSVGTRAKTGTPPTPPTGQP